MLKQSFRYFGIITLLTLSFLFVGCDLFEDDDDEGISAIIVFGDSISDTGNVFLATNGAVPVSPPYFNGRFSNGSIWVEALADAFELAVTPLLAGGTNFAVGAARASRDLEVVIPQGSFTVPSLLSQVDLFFDRFGKADSDALYIIFIGGDDIRSILIEGLDPMTTIDTAIANIATAISDLADSGARKFFVPTVPNVGRSPESAALGPDVPAEATDLSVLFNQTLNTMLDTVEAERSVRIFRLDTFALLEDIVSNPETFGLTNVTDGCLDGDEFSGGTPCDDPDSYLFWDSMHASVAGHAILAEAALGAIATLTSN